nr:uncharacterized protein LOC127299826 [Lolium perenne]
MWTIGDVFGKTKDLDIVFTRANKVLRILVTCLDPTLIPNTWDLKIKNDFFRLRFEVEGLQRSAPADVTMTDLPKHDDDVGGSGNGQSGNASNRETKRSKSISSNETDKDDTNKSSAHKTSTGITKSSSVLAHGLGKEHNTHKTPVTMQTEHVESTLSAEHGGRNFLSTHTVPILNDKAHLEEEVRRSSLRDHQPRHADHAKATSIAEMSGAQAGQKAVLAATARTQAGHKVVVAGPTVAPPLSEAAGSSPRRSHSGPVWRGSQGMQTQPNMHGFGCSRAGTEGKRIFTREEIIAFGGIPEPKASDVRASARIGAQATVDQTQMERAMYAAQRRSTLGTTGYSSCGALATTMGISAPVGPAGYYGYWMQPAPGGHSGLLFPGYWMASH